MQKLLTVAVPCYNVEKYLDRCLGSFVAGGVRNELEVIAVNDGSTDGTEAIALSFTDKYPDIFRVITKENGGHGSGINTGLANARGRYFKVVDGDDWVNPDVFGDYLDLLARTDADMVVTDFCCCDAVTCEVTERRGAITGNAAPDTFGSFDELSPEFFARMHSITYRTELLRENGIVIDEKRFYVDMEYIAFPVPYLKRVYLSDLPVYMYRLGLGGQSVSMEGLRRHADDHIAVLDHLLAYIRVNSGIMTAAQKSYCERVAAEMVAMQHQIYLSYPLGSGKRAEMTALSRRLKERHRGVYDANNNPAVSALRASGFLLFPLASAAVRLLKK